MSLRYLKIKIKSLAAEQSMIRHEEHKAKSAYRYAKEKQGLERQYEQNHSEFWGLRNHRVNDVRPEARAALVAYGFLRGKKYNQIEKPDKYNPPNWEKVKRLVAKYGPTNARPIVGDSLVEEWKDVADSNL